MAMQKYNDSLEIFQKKLGIHIETKLKIDGRVKNAVLVQDNIRSKVKGWNGTAEIRKWRDQRTS